MGLVKDVPQHICRDSDDGPNLNLNESVSSGSDSFSDIVAVILNISHQIAPQK